MSYVNIKSIPNGIKIQLDENCNFSKLVDEIGQKFHDSKNFFKGGKIAVTFMGRKLSDEEENILIETMEQNGEFSVLYLIEDGQTKENSVTKALDKEPQNVIDKNGFGTVYRNTVYKGEHLEFPYGVIIMGDVEPGSLIKAGGSVIVMGGLYGNVNITDETNTKFFVAALEMNPERIKFGETRYYCFDKPKWSIRPKYQAKMAYLRDDDIVVEEISRKTLRTFLNV